MGITYSKQKLDTSYPNNEKQFDTIQRPTLKTIQRQYTPIQRPTLKTIQRQYTPIQLPTLKTIQRETKRSRIDLSAPLDIDKTYNPYTREIKRIGKLIKPVTKPHNKLKEYPKHCDEKDMYNFSDKVINHPKNWSDLRTFPS